MLTLSQLSASLLTPLRLATAWSGGKWRPAPHLLAIDRAIMAAYVGRGPKVITVEAPPRHGKTEFCCKWIPQHHLIHWPANRVLLTSYSAGLAKISGRHVRDNMKRHARDWGTAVNANVEGAGEWELAAGGGMVATGIGGTVTGRGANLLVMDDTIKDAEEAVSDERLKSQWDWFQTTAKTRLEPGGVLLAVGTRWRERDMIGRLHQLERENPQFRIAKLRFPAIAEANDVLGRPIGAALWPERFPIDHLLAEKSTKEPYWWNALYQQRPGQYGRNEWPDDYFADPFWAEVWPAAFEVTCAGLDPSKGKDTGDFSAIVSASLSGGKIWIEADISRRPVPRIVADSIGFCQARRIEHFAVEGNGFQELLGPEFDRATTEMRAAPLPIVMLDNRINKNLRIGRLGPYLARHQFRFRNTPGTRVLVEQLKAFPFGDHDDGPDAMEMAVRTLLWAINKIPETEEAWEA